MPLSEIFQFVLLWCRCEYQFHLANICRGANNVLHSSQIRVWNLESRVWNLLPADIANATLLQLLKRARVVYLNLITPLMYGMPIRVDYRILISYFLIKNASKDAFNKTCIGVISSTWCLAYAKIAAGSWTMTCFDGQFIVYYRRSRTVVV